MEKCGASSAGAIGGATTGPGGVWESEPPDPLGSGTYRAKWETRLSAPVTFRVSVRPTVAHFQRGRHLPRVFADAKPEPTLC
jgi:hypothetical protein